MTSNTIVGKKVKHERQVQNNPGNILNMKKSWPSWQLFFLKYEQQTSLFRRLISSFFQKGGKDDHKLSWGQKKKRETLKFPLHQHEFDNNNTNLSTLSREQSETKRLWTVTKVSTHYSDFSQQLPWEEKKSSQRSMDDVATQLRLMSRGTKAEDGSQRVTWPRRRCSSELSTGGQALDVLTTTSQVAQLLATRPNISEPPASCGGQLLRHTSWRRSCLFWRMSSFPVDLVTPCLPHEISSLNCMGWWYQEKGPAPPILPRPQSGHVSTWVKILVPEVTTCSKD